MLWSIDVEKENFMYPISACSDQLKECSVTISSILEYKDLENRMSRGKSGYRRPEHVSHVAAALLD